MCHSRRPAGARSHLGGSTGEPNDAIAQCDALRYRTVRYVRELRWTDDAEQHIGRHGVRPEEVEDVVNTRPRLVARGRENTELIFGTTASGRFLIVVLAPWGDGRDGVVTARDMTTSERRQFRRRSR
jgi:uncharacterized protein